MSAKFDQLKFDCQSPMSGVEAALEYIQNDPSLPNLQSLNAALASSEKPITRFMRRYGEGVVAFEFRKPLAILHGATQQAVLREIETQSAEGLRLLRSTMQLAERFPRPAQITFVDE